jgi:hypothetical protein
MTSRPPHASPELVIFVGEGHCHLDGIDKISSVKSGIRLPIRVQISPSNRCHRAKDTINEGSASEPFS